ncbi:hypothetical protein OAO35_00940 [Euryarchaeota archaeon]|jgi:hypothetical protein|nr:hypothetical protein [Euryarchaeota archaeon]
MAELVKKLGLPQPDGFLYFVEKDCTVWKHQGGQKTLISDAAIEREEGYLYFIDLNGDLAKKSNIQQRDKDTNDLFKPGTQVPRD